MLHIIDDHARIADDIWFAYLEYVSDVTRISLEFWLRLAKDAFTRAIYGDLDVPLVFGE